MARVTVEDCVDKVPNRFDLILLAAQRSRMIREGSPLTVDRDNDKDPVVSLREIADESIDLKVVKESLVAELQEVRPGEEEEREAEEAISRRREKYHRRLSRWSRYRRRRHD